MCCYHTEYDLECTWSAPSRLLATWKTVQVRRKGEMNDAHHGDGSLGPRAQLSVVREKILLDVTIKIVNVDILSGSPPGTPTTHM